MEYPLVQIKTKDNLILHGLFSEGKKAHKIIIHFHGTAGQFYGEEFIKNMFLKFPKIGFSFLSTNNRGSSILGDSWQNTGSAIEKFEDCLIDIDGWIEDCLKKGYREIILQGHSLGTEKIVYYMNKGKYKDKISKIILLGFSDSYGNAQKFMGKRKEQFFKEAKKLIQKGGKEQFLTIEHKSHAGILPKSASSFINQFSENSELSKSFSFWQKGLDYYSNIKVPILAIISDNDKHTMDRIVTNGSEHVMMSIEKAINLLKKENPHTIAIKMKNTNHDFENKEKELTKNICSFLEK